MTSISSIVLFFLSLLMVAYGQPAEISWLGLVVGACGFSLIFYVLLNLSSGWQRFLIGTLWFTLVQMIQLYWFTSHHYVYIYMVYFCLSLWVGIEFGILSLFIRPQIIGSVLGCLSLAAGWTLLEWSRMFVLSGFTWNPVGLTLSGSDYARQLASVGGIFGLSFWVIFTNSLAIRSYLKRSFPYAWIAAALFPYVFGILHITSHSHFSHFDNSKKNFRVLLVQTAFPVEEAYAPMKPENLISYVVDQWTEIVETLHKFHGEKLDLIVLPEFVVPFGTYPFAFPAGTVYKAFSDVCGTECVNSLPHLTSPFAAVLPSKLGPQVMVNNAYWGQAIANVFNASVLMGLEDADDDAEKKRHYYNAAFLFHPQTGTYDVPLESLERYEKRVLVPMGEYIPFEFCRKIAARYGIASSFTRGTEAKVMWVQGVPFSPSICYEETYSHIVQEGRAKGANLLVNLTSDAWYPESTLPLQHFEHSRLRTVENGVPLVRACNNGVTGGFGLFWPGHRGFGRRSSGRCRMDAGGTSCGCGFAALLDFVFTFRRWFYCRDKLGDIAHCRRPCIVAP